MSVRTTRSKSLLQSHHQESYVRTRDDPFFDGMRKGYSPLRDRTSLLDFQGNEASKNMARTASDIDIRGSINISTDLSNNITYSPSKFLPEDIILEPLRRSVSERWSKISKISSSQSPNAPTNVETEFEEGKNLLKEFKSTPREEFQMLSGQERAFAERVYSLKKRTEVIDVQLPPSAASFYCGFTPQIEIIQSCDEITRLNFYLKAKRNEVNAGCPGKFLHAVLGQDLADIGSVASTIMYAFYLNETQIDNHMCTVPIINMKRPVFDSHAELKWLLDSCHIDHSSLIFVDEIDLSYYDLFGSLKLVLLNGDRLPAKQEALKEALVEIFNCRKEDAGYSSVQTVTIGQDCSCCTLIAEKYLLTSPKMLSGQGFSRLLLAGILFDTGNLTNTQCTSKDKYMSSLLINGAGRYGCSGLYQILRYKMHDVSNLKVRDILRKDFKKWTRVGKPEGTGSKLTVSYFAMSSIGMPIGQFVAQDVTTVQEITNFGRLEKLRMLMVVSGYYDSHKNFKREILISTEHEDLMENLLLLFKLHSSKLPLKVLHISGLGEDMRAFEINKVTSRKTIERFLEEFGTSFKC